MRKQSRLVFVKRPAGERTDREVARKPIVSNFLRGKTFIDWLYLAVI